MRLFPQKDLVFNLILLILTLGCRKHFWLLENYCINRLKNFYVWKYSILNDITIFWVSPCPNLFLRVGTVYGEGEFPVIAPSGSPRIRRGNKSGLRPGCGRYYP
jgi:hypothetical protein